jgi:hypothetical protein
MSHSFAYDLPSKINVKNSSKNSADKISEMKINQKCEKLNCSL